MLDVRDVAKTFFDPRLGPVRALGHVSMRLAAGCVALVGANGAGKTTLLRLITGLLRPDQGRICVDGLDLAQEPDAVRARIGFLATSTRLYARLSAREMLAYTGGFYGMSRQRLDERVEVLVRMFDLEDFIDRRCGGLSTGQAQRVNLARTMLADPRVLLLDEPSTGLDIAAARQVIQAVRAANDGRRLVLLCTHDLSEVEELADELLVLRAGRLIWRGALSELAPDPDARRARILAMIADEADEADEGSS